MNRRKNAKRKGAETGEVFTLRDVAERDGWRCHLCGGAVDPLTPSTQPKGGTVDHLVPLAHGGRDEFVNVALAHRECNVRRGARGVVQLRLVA